MPETFGIPEPVPPVIERARTSVEGAIAGKSVVRVVLLYLAVGALTLTPLAPLGILPLLMLMATDSDLSA